MLSSTSGKIHKKHKHRSIDGIQEGESASSHRHKEHKQRHRHKKHREPPPPPQLLRHINERLKEVECAKKREEEKEWAREREWKKELERYEREQEVERRKEKDKGRERMERDRERERDKERARDREVREKERDRTEQRDRERDRVRGREHRVEPDWHHHERDRDRPAEKSKDRQPREKRSPSSIPENGAGDSLSIEETNKLRAKLGLKPLEVDSGPTKPSSTSIAAAAEAKKVQPGEKELSAYKDEWGEFLHKPAANLNEKAEAEKKREKLKQLFLENQLARISILGESDEEADNVSKWVTRSRRAVDEKREADKTVCRALYLII